MLYYYYILFIFYFKFCKEEEIDDRSGRWESNRCILRLLVCSNAKLPQLLYHKVILRQF